jgi:hypothetical protein
MTQLKSSLTPGSSLSQPNESTTKRLPVFRFVGVAIFINPDIAHKQLLAAAQVDDPARHRAMRRSG